MTEKEFKQLQETYEWRAIKRGENFIGQVRHKIWKAVKETPITEKQLPFNGQMLGRPKLTLFTQEVSGWVLKLVSEFESHSNPIDISASVKPALECKSNG